jgi:murein hydrolase activator
MRFLVLFLALSFACQLGAQSAGDLKEKRKKLLREIDRNTQKLTVTRREQETTLEQLSLLQAQMRKRGQLIQTLQTEIDQTESGIERTSIVVEALSHDIGALKTEYAHTLRSAYRARLTRSWLSFLFSARSINDAFRRWQYLRQYHRYRQKQAHLITETQRTLQEKLTQMELRREEKAQLLESAEQQRQLLGRESKEQDKLLGNLKASENALLTEINKQQKAHETLNEAIEKAIAEEMARALAKSRSASREEKSSSTPGGNTRAGEPASAETTGFAARRGRLPWPVNSSKVTRRFGRQEHPTARGIEISNNGIDINAGSNADVNAVYGGEVIATRYIPGYRYMVLVKHGSFFTAYSNLETLSVGKGDKIDAGQRLGHTADTGDLHFEIWRQQERLNPEHWLAKK